MNGTDVVDTADGDKAYVIARLPHEAMEKVAAAGRNPVDANWYSNDPDDADEGI